MYLAFNSTPNVGISDVSGEYTFNFKSNSTDFSQFKIEKVLLGWSIYYDDTRIYNWGTWTKSTYKYIYIDDNVFNSLDNSFKTWLLNNTTKPVGYYQEVSGLEYFIDMKNTPEAAIQNCFNTSLDRIDAGYLATLTTENFFDTNFNNKIFDCFYFKDSSLKYINIIKGNLSVDTDLTYGGTFYYDSNNYIKYIDLKGEESEKYLVGIQVDNQWYIGLSTTYSSTNPLVTIDNENRLTFTANSTSYYFIGTSSFNMLDVSTNSADASSIELITVTNNVTQPINSNYYLNANNLKLFLNLTSIDVKINNSSFITKLPYELLGKTDEYNHVEVSSNNINWSEVNGLRYILPDYKYYKYWYILDTPVLSINLDTLVISWNAIHNAQSYKLKLNIETDTSSTEVEYDLASTATSYQLEPEEDVRWIKAEIKAIGDNNLIVNSAWSNYVIYKNGIFVTVMNKLNKNNVGYYLSGLSYTLNKNESRDHFLQYDSTYYVGFMPQGSSQLAPGWTQATKNTHTFSNSYVGDGSTDVTLEINQRGSTTAKNSSVYISGIYEAGRTRFEVPLPFDFNSDHYLSNGQWKTDSSKFLTITYPTELGVPSSEYILQNPMVIYFNGNYSGRSYSFNVSNIRIDKPSIYIERYY